MEKAFKVIAECNSIMIVRVRYIAIKKEESIVYKGRNLTCAVNPSPL